MTFKVIYYANANICVLNVYQIQSKAELIFFQPADIVCRTDISDARCSLFDSTMHYSITYPSPSFSSIKCSLRGGKDLALSYPITDSKDEASTIDTSAVTHQTLIAIVRAGAAEPQADTDCRGGALSKIVLQETHLCDNYKI